MGMVNEHHIVTQNDTSCSFQLSMLVDEVKKCYIQNELKSAILEKRILLFFVIGYVIL
jgi:hypothetical protein